MVRVKHGKDTIISNKLVAEAYVSLSEWQKHARWHGECSHANAHTACGIWCGMLARKHTMLHVASGVACLHANAHGACGKLACANRQKGLLVVMLEVQLMKTLPGVARGGLPWRT
eukprot:scaffold74452_cov20-Tisochrysis_lutea.AAC.1